MEKSQILKLNKTAVKTLFYIILYKFILDIGYYYYINPIYYYEGFAINFNLSKAFCAYLFVVLIALSLPRNEYPSSISLALLNIIIIVPCTTIFSMKDESWSYMLAITTSFLLMCFLTHILPKIKITRVYVKSFDVFLWAILFGNGLVLFLCFIQYGAPSFEALNLSIMYTLRAERKSSIALFSYIVSWVANVANPLILSVFIKKKKYKMILFLALIQFLIFLYVVQKSVIFYPILIWALGMILEREKAIEKLYILLPIVFVGGLSLFVAVGNNIISMLLLYRGIFLPAQISFQYHKYFSAHGFTQLSHSIFKVFFTNPVYDENPILIIGRLFYTNNHPNTGFLADAYMNFGVVGMAIFSILLIILLKIIDGLVVNTNLEHIGKVYSVIIAVSLSNVGLLTSILTGGILIYMLLLWIYDDKDKIGFCE